MTPSNPLPTRPELTYGRATWKHAGGRRCVPDFEYFDERMRFLDAECAKEPERHVVPTVYLKCPHCTRRGAKKYGGLCFSCRIGGKAK